MTSIPSPSLRAVSIESVRRVYRSASGSSPSVSGTLFAGGVRGSVREDQTVDHGLDGVHFVTVQLDLLVQVANLTVHAGADKAGLADLFKHALVVSFAVAYQRREDQDAAAGGHVYDGVDDLLRALPFDRAAAVGTVGDSDPRIEQAQVVIDLCHRAHRRARVVAHTTLIDRYRRAQAFNLVDVRLLHLAQELPGVGRQRLDIPALAFGIDGVKGQARLARAREAGDNDQLVARNVDGDVF